MATAQAALDSARVYLNDVGSQIWDNNTLLPYLKEAHKDLLLVLWLNDIPVIKEISSTPINVAALGITITVPTDLLEPIEIKERTQGSSEDWILMREMDYIPVGITQETTLRYWSWREEVLNLIGATTAREVIIKYWKSLSELSSANSNLGFTLAEAFLGPQAAGYAAGSVSNLTLAGELLWIQGQSVGIAGAKLDMILRANIKGQQNLPVRRIPYRRFTRFRY